MANFPVFDGHNDLPYALRTEAGYAVDSLGRGDARFHTDLPRLASGGVGAQFWSVWVPSSLREPDAVAATLEQIDAVERMIAAYPERLARSTSADEVQAAAERGRIASLMGIEGGHAIGGSLAVLRSMYRLGVRYMTLTHNDDVAWATSATGERERTAAAEGAPGARSATGLSEEGAAVVREMNRLGMLVDLSHTNEATQLDALRLSAAPPFYSHSSVQGVAAHPRNVTDAALEALRSAGGVLAVTFVPAFVSPAQVEWAALREAERERLGLPTPLPRDYFFPRAPRPGESADAVARQNAAAKRAHEDEPLDPDLGVWEQANPLPEATLDDVVAHIEYAREWLGADGIALGGDYDGTPVLPRGLEDVSRYPALLERLAERGFSRRDLEKLAWGNTMRVLRDAEDAADTA